MKNLIAFLPVLLLGLTVPALAAPNVEGDYELYNEAQPERGVVARMNFFNQKGNDFLVAGVGWGATGHLDGDAGYYDWNFKDGRKGRTAFTVRKDGGLRGHVVGDGNDINWVFIAKKVTPTPAKAPCSACYAEQETRTKGCEQMNDLMARNDCINKANAVLSKCLENCAP